MCKAQVQSGCASAGGGRWHLGRFKLHLLGESGDIVALLCGALCSATRAVARCTAPPTRLAEIGARVKGDGHR